jgi:hypothetical protein
MVGWSGKVEGPVKLSRIDSLIDIHAGRMHYDEYLRLSYGRAAAVGAPTDAVD